MFDPSAIGDGTQNSSPNPFLMDDEFSTLCREQEKSGCDKKKIVAGCYASNGRDDPHWVTAVNYCEHDGDVCPRLHLPSGVGYELCKSHHAEAELARILSERQLMIVSPVWVYGHYWACEPCASALKALGCREIRVREEL